jgi:hypothetical protein
MGQQTNLGRSARLNSWTTHLQTSSPFGPKNAYLSVWGRDKGQFVWKLPRRK